MDNRLEDFASNYSQWLQSLDQSLQYAALSGVVGENSLLGLWELLPAGHEARAEELKNKFVELSGESYAELCNQFKLKEDIGGKENDTQWTALSYKLIRKNSNKGENYNPQKPTPEEIGNIPFLGHEPCFIAQHHDKNKNQRDKISEK